jgi:hypothetical protein
MESGLGEVERLERWVPFVAVAEVRNASVQKGGRHAEA